MSARIEGTADPAFAPLAEAFAAGFKDRPAMGAALSLWIGGRQVVDLWGGVADARDGRPWGRDTATVVYSCTKGLVSILAAQLVEEGRVTYDTPIADLWPEFAAGGKGAVTFGQALSHRAGLSAPRADLTFADIIDWDRICAVLAAQEPLWEPGAGYAYHALTHGWLAGEVIRRITGKTVGRLFAERIADPLGTRVWIGLPAAELPRLTHVAQGEGWIRQWAEEEAKPAPNWPMRAMSMGGAIPPALVSDTGGFNDPRALMAEIPGAGGVATARGLAEVWSATVDSRALLTPAARARAVAVQSEGKPVFDLPPPYGRWGMGFQLDSPSRALLGAGSFGHGGAGGQLGFADSDHGVGFAYVTNWMMGAEDTRSASIVTALREVLARG